MKAIISTLPAALAASPALACIGVRELGDLMEKTTWTVETDANYTTGLTAGGEFRRERTWLRVTVRDSIGLSRLRMDSSRDSNTRCVAPQMVVSCRYRRQYCRQSGLCRSKCRTWGIPMSSAVRQSII